MQDLRQPMPPREWLFICYHWRRHWRSSAERHWARLEKREYLETLCSVRCGLAWCMELWWDGCMALGSVMAISRFSCIISNLQCKIFFASSRTFLWLHFGVHVPQDFWLNPTKARLLRMPRQLFFSVLHHNWLAPRGTLFPQDSCKILQTFSWVHCPSTNMSLSSKLAITDVDLKGKRVLIRVIFLLSSFPRRPI